MNNIIITVLLILSQTSYSQHPLSGVVEYTVEPVAFNNATYDNNAKLDVKEKKEIVEMLSTPATFIMEFTSSESLYKSKEQEMKSDAERPKLNFLKIYGGKGVFYSNSTEKLTINQKDAFGELVLVSFTFPNWDLTNESKKIGEFTCYKAIKKAVKDGKKSEEIAWYSPQIPVQFGPSLYNGLPGLVLEVQVGKIRFIASKINLNTSNVLIERPNKGTKMSAQEYYKKLKQIAEEIGF